MSNTTSQLNILLANTYTLYLKTQNYHWNVTGSHFSMLHEFFEEQYTHLADATDKIAERIRAKGMFSPGSFSEFSKLKTLTEAKSEISHVDMIKDLMTSHSEIRDSIVKALKVAREEEDEVTQDLLIERLEYHEKILWMLKSTLG